MSLKESPQLNITDVVLGAFKKYSAHKDYTAGDYLLQLFNSSESTEFSKIGERRNLGQLLTFVRAVGLNEQLLSGTAPREQPSTPDTDDDTEPSEGFILNVLYSKTAQDTYQTNVSAMRLVVDYAVSYMLYCVSLSSLAEAAPDKYDQFWTTVAEDVWNWGADCLWSLTGQDPADSVSVLVGETATDESADADPEPTDTEDAGTEEEDEPAEPVEHSRHQITSDFYTTVEWQQDVINYLNDHNADGHLNPPEPDLEPAEGDGSQAEEWDPDRYETPGQIVYVWEDTQWVRYRYGKWYMKARDGQLQTRAIAATESDGLHQVQANTISFLNLLLVKNDDFVKIYLNWLMTLARIEAKVDEILSWQTIGVPPSLHNGKLFFSALADTDRKAHEDFGGKAYWKRILNFPLLVYNPNKADEANEVQTRGGESFVSLTKDNIPNHTHVLTSQGSDGTKDTWKPPCTANNTDHPGTEYISEKKPGLTWSSKKIYPEVAQLNWSNDYPKSGAPTTGGARYVRPHFNIPPYRDVFIWQYNYTPQNGAVRSSAAPTTIELEGAARPEQVARASTEPIKFSDLPGDNSTNQNYPSQYKNSWNINKREIMGMYDALCMLVSDRLEGEEQIRYDTKDMTLQELSELASWYVWYNSYHVERRYLYRDAYQFLLKEIQDRIYEIVKALADFFAGLKKGSVILPEKLCKGQYVFLYDYKDDASALKCLNTYYRKPAGCDYVAVNGKFLRGAATFTDATRYLFTMYCTDKDKAKTINNIKCTGGRSTVDLYADNFPKHLHWSTLISPQTSMKFTRPGNKTGGYGSVFGANDPRSGGVKFDYTSGSGPYKFSIAGSGQTQPISHSNIPDYITLRTYLVI